MGCYQNGDLQPALQNSISSSARPADLHILRPKQICVRQEGSEDEVESLETSEDGWRDDESELFIQLISCDHVLFVCVLFTYLDT